MPAPEGLPLMSDQPLRRRLLLVDDDPFVHRQVRHIAGRDFDVHCTLSTVTVTPDMLASLDTLVLDLNLPDGDAIGFMQGLGESARDIRLILVSGLEAKTIRLTATVARQLQFRSVEIAAKPLSAVKLAPLLQCSVPRADSVAESPGAPVLPGSQTLEEELHRALARNEFLSHFQPQFDLNSRRCTGAEALCRWAHPRLGLIGPASIIDTLEGGPLSMAFSLYMLDDAIERFKAATAGTEFAGTLSVNMPVSALESTRLANHVSEILRRHDFPAQRLTVEITERGISRDAACSSATIASLRIRGVRISLDDFGTGYSSFEKLKDLAIDEIKIDKHFVADVIDSRTSQTLVQAAISIADEMGLRVVAEGIETPAAADWLAAQGHLLGQGYLYARPLDPTSFRECVLQQTTPPDTPRRAVTPARPSTRHQDPLTQPQH